ncbi:MAG: DUF2269 family protein [Jatrophihabitans sp.]|nr:MAG: DUF2269 family protein [Jatrophihabitans sp.]
MSSGLYDLALFLHLFGAFSLVSGTVVAGVGFEIARRRRSCAEIALALSVSRIGALLLVAGATLAAGFGLWLVALGHWGWGAPWVDLAIAALIVIAAVGGYAGQPAKRARRLAVHLSGEGREPTPQLIALLNDRIALALNYAAAVILVGIVVDMVFKPGA